MNKTDPNTTPQESVDIVAEIVNYLRRYMAFQDDDQPLALALWVLHTYTFNPSFPQAPWTTPYLYVYSDGPGCGKTLLMDLLASVAHNTLPTAGMSASAMFRLIESVCPTIMIDEIDTIYRGGGGNGPAKYEDLRNILNSGYRHGGSTYKTEGLEPVKYRTFGPKLLAGIRDDKAEIPNTVLTRSLRIKLSKKGEAQKTEIYRSRKAGPIAEELSELIAAWVKVNAMTIADYEPSDDDFPNRDYELAEPLLQIAHAAGIEQAAREALIRLMAPEPVKETGEERVFRIIRDLFDTNGDALFTADISDALDGMSGKALSGYLRPWNISGGNFVERDGRKGRGYFRHQFTDAFEKMGL